MISEKITSNYLKFATIPNSYVSLLNQRHTSLLLSTLIITLVFINQVFWLTI